MSKKINKVLGLEDIVVLQWGNVQYESRFRFLGDKHGYWRVDEWLNSWTNKVKVIHFPSNEERILKVKDKHLIYFVKVTKTPIVITPIYNEKY